MCCHGHVLKVHSHILMMASEFEMEGQMRKGIFEKVGEKKLHEN